MKSFFKTWSQSNPESLEKINPTLGMRDWNDLDINEKQKIWKYFYNNEWFHNSLDLFSTIQFLNEKYKRQSYGVNLLNHGGPHFDQDRYNYETSLSLCCCNASLSDFQSIFLDYDQNIVFEILTIYTKLLINNSLIKSINENTDSKEEIDNTLNEAYKKADLFIEEFNDIFEQFSINVSLTRNGIVFRQDSKITKEIYLPVLAFLSDKKWKPVNRDLSDAFQKFQEKTPQGYSSCITNAISALQSFLQILILGKTGTGDISVLIKSSKANSIIPLDDISKNIFNNIVSFLMRTRQDLSDAHPKKTYANEKTAKLVLNLVMVFIQHCIV